MNVKKKKKKIEKVKERIENASWKANVAFDQPKVVRGITVC